ncbi:MAG: hypothetical protein J6D28_03090 [Bacilli bacterium]|nr:hypothetical protein [Bacilli bacterium]
MYKKILVTTLFLLTIGCTSKPKEIIRKEITCTVEENNFTLVLENGQITKYIDEIEGDLGQETVDILNEEHLLGIKDNDEALKIMDQALKDLGGSCK